MGADIELPGERSRWHYRQVVGWFGATLMRLLGGWHITGREHIPQEGAALICPNHISYLDPPLVGIAAKRRCCYMAKGSLFDIPVLGWFIRRMVTKFGGVQKYRQVRVLMFGVIAGDLLGRLIFMIVGAIHYAVTSHPPPEYGLFYS